MKQTVLDWAAEGGGVNLLPLSFSSVQPRILLALHACSGAWSLHSQNPVCWPEAVSPLLCHT